jgi:sialate O-acetylesterase
MNHTTTLNTTTLILGLALLLNASNAGSASVALPHIFTDHMVLQRQMPVPVWGTATPDEKVSVSFACQTKTATATADGHWSVTLDPLQTSSTPGEMTITGSNTVKFEDVLVGEVWLCSGQSNMGKPVGTWRGMNPTPNYELELADANYPLIRILQPQAAKREAPAEDFDETVRPKAYPHGGWVACNGVVLDQLKFSAVGYFFGRKLFQELKVPIGLINSSVGGTRIEAWLAPASFATDPALVTDFEKLPVITDPAKPPRREVAGELYNGMVAPITPYAIRGVIWYQGESNVYVNDGSAYAPKMIALINGWRLAWHQELAFYYVQLPPLKYSTTRKQVKDAEQLPLLREAQAAALKLPHTGMIVTTDLADDLGNIHPVNKVPVGERLAAWALANDYGRKDIEVSGPMFQSMEIEGSKAILHFQHVGKGLVSKDGQPLNSFMIAGHDGKFYPANAEISGNTVVVTSPQVPNPSVVCFAWDEAAEPNFFNKDGLPAMPFRTDNPLTK